MGKSSRWFLNFIGVKSKSSSSKDKPPPVDEKKSSAKDEQKNKPRERRRWSFGRSSTRDSAVEAIRRSEHSSGFDVLTDSISFEKEQSKHAIAVAAASAAAAEAAVAAAEAAAAVVRLTSTGGSFRGSVCLEDWAAVTIQAAFRGYLARRALRALKGVVRLQALFRGHLVRKQAAMTLHCMQALVRVQNRARSRRTLSSEESQTQSVRRQQHHTQVRARKSVDGWDGSTVSLDDVQARFDQRQLGVLKREKAHSLQRGEHPTVMNCDAEAYSWLERWMASRPWEAPPAAEETRDCPESATLDRSSEGSTKVVEMDSGKLRRRHRKKSFDSLSYEAPAPFSNPWSTPPSGEFQPYMRAASYDGRTRRPNEQDCGAYSAADFEEDEDGLLSTAKSSPAFSTTGCSKGSRRSHQQAAVEDIYYNYADYPGYMASTKSTKAKTRSHSAPRQRPVSSSSSTERSHSRKRNSLSGVELHRPPSCGSLRPPSQPQRHISPSRRSRPVASVESRSWMSGSSFKDYSGDFRRPFRP